MKSRTLRSIVILAATLANVVAPAAQAAQVYFVSQTNSGILGIGGDTNCITSQFETPLESAFDGYSIRDGTYPAVGEVWYAHVYISHPGNPCSGGNANGIQIVPPANTAFAISAAYPVFCALYSPHDNLTRIYYRQDQGCPQAPSPGSVGYYFWAYNGATAVPWTIASYADLEILIPLTSNTTLNGQTLGFRVEPDVAVAGDVSVGVVVQGDTIFRDDADGITLTPDLCTVSSCYLQP